MTSGYLDYNKILCGTFTFDVYDRIVWLSSIELKSKSVQNKMACFFPSYISDSPVQSITNATHGSIYSKPQDVSLYVSRECKISRDLYRNSGYKIVRDPSKADFIVIPTLPRLYETQRYDIIALDNSSGTLMLACMTDKERLHNNEKSYFDSVKSYLTALGYDVYSTSIENSFCYFLPKYEIFKEILTCTHPGRAYISELDVPVDPPVKINLETLLIWDACKDDDIIAKAICQSDWQKFPVTLYAFLEIHSPIYSSNNNFKLVCDSIQYNRYNSLTGIAGRSVSPEDWNMLQDYIFSKYHLPSSGGILQDKDYHTRISSFVKKIINFGLAVAPKYITTETSTDFLIST